MSTFKLLTTEFGKTTEVAFFHQSPIAKREINAIYGSNMAQCNVTQELLEYRDGAWQPVMNTYGGLGWYAHWDFGLGWHITYGVLLVAAVIFGIIYGGYAYFEQNLWPLIPVAIVWFIHHEAFARRQIRRDQEIFLELIGRRPGRVILANDLKLAWALGSNSYYGIDPEAFAKRFGDRDFATAQAITTNPVICMAYAQVQELEWQQKYRSSYPGHDKYMQWARSAADEKVRKILALADVEREIELQQQRDYDSAKLYGNNRAIGGLEAL